jgi:hypothetical protein
VAQVVKHLPSKHEALSSNPSIVRRKGKNGKEGEEKKRKGKKRMKIKNRTYL